MPARDENASRIEINAPLLLPNIKLTRKPLNGAVVAYARTVT
jgi:hypothetical protein